MNWGRRGDTLQEMLRLREERITKLEQERARLRREVARERESRDEWKSNFFRLAYAGGKPRIDTLGDIQTVLIEMIRAGAHPGSIDYVLRHKIRWDDKETWEDVRARYTPETVGGLGENRNHEHND